MELVSHEDELESKLIVQDEPKVMKDFGLFVNFYEETKSDPKVDKSTNTAKAPSKRSKSESSKRGLRRKRSRKRRKHRSKSRKLSDGSDSDTI